MRTVFSIRVCCRAVDPSATTEAVMPIAVVSTEAVTEPPTTLAPEPGRRSLERGDAAASGRIYKVSYDLS